MGCPVHHPLVLRGTCVAVLSAGNRVGLDSAQRCSMASSRTKKTRTGTSYVVCFRFGGRLYNRSLGEVSAGDAEARRKRVEATVHDIGTGRLTVPLDADAGLFILSDGKMTEKTKTAVPDEQVTLEMLWEQYRQDLPEGAKKRFQNRFGPYRIGVCMLPTRR